MLRIASALVISVSFIAAAAAQTQPGGSASRPAAGAYSGTLQQQGGSGSSNVKLTIRDITPDGRVTARVQSSHPYKPCTANLPASGLLLKDGSMRLEVDAGAPEGCERIYEIKSASGGAVSGTYIEATRSGGGKLIARRK